MKVREKENFHIVIYYSTLTPPFSSYINHIHISIIELMLG